MQTTYNPGARETLIVLNKFSFDAGLFKNGFAVALEKIATVIAKNARFDNE
jgi:hypothetical protein